MMLRHPAARADAASPAPTMANLQNNLAAVPAVASASLPQPHAHMAATGAAPPAAPAGSGRRAPRGRPTPPRPRAPAPRTIKPGRLCAGGQAARVLGGGHVRRDTADGVPHQELSVAPGAPAAAAAGPARLRGASQDRFVMINMHKLRGGRCPGRAPGECHPEGCGTVVQRLAPSCCRALTERAAAPARRRRPASEV
jgi:hypothetical protein